MVAQQRAERRIPPGCVFKLAQAGIAATGFSAVEAAKLKLALADAKAQWCTVAM